MSKPSFRHVYGDDPKPEHHFLDMKNPSSAGEGRFVAAGTKFFAVAKAGGGGPVYVKDYSKPGRHQISEGMLNTHKGRVLDMAFHPFINNMLATASEDCKIHLSLIPKDGLTENLGKQEMSLEGHGKKVALLDFHPTANGVLASGSYDRTVRIWNIETADQMAQYDDLTDNIFSLSWNYDGSILGTTCKDKVLRMVDPRAIDSTVQVIKEAFTSVKSSKLFWVPNLNWVGCCGFSKSAKRQLKVWDMKKIDEPVYSMDIDAAGAVLYPYYDIDTGLLYLAGKGEGSIHYFELSNTKGKYIHPVSTFRTSVPQKGGAWVPKRALDTKKCEIARFMKLTKDSVVPVSFILPRKSGAEIFQEDIYPNTYAGKPALTADEYLNGDNKEPPKMSMDPDKRGESGNEDMVFEKKKTYQELSKENKELKKRIQELEDELKNLKGETETTNDEEEQKDEPTPEE